MSLIAGGPFSENTNQTVWQEWAPVDANGNSPYSSSRPMSIGIDSSALTGSGDTYRIWGSNEAPATPTTNAGDAVPVADDSGSNAARAVTLGFTRGNWPYKYIGVQFIKGTGTTTGTYNVYYNAPMQGVQIN